MESYCRLGSDLSHRQREPKEESLVTAVLWREWAKSAQRSGLPPMCSGGFLNLGIQRLPLFRVGAAEG
jgi:hypothetical protein